jgi:Rod binding domain-containing protein
MIEPVASTTGTSATTTAKSDQVAKGFEQLLVQQLAQEMMKTVTSWKDDDSSDGSGSADGMGGAYASMLPDALTSAVEQAGGLGLSLGLEDTAKASS